MFNGRSKEHQGRTMNRVVGRGRGRRKLECKGRIWTPDSLKNEEVGRETSPTPAGGLPRQDPLESKLSG